MQEYGWFHWDRFDEMAFALGGSADARKMRLAACACVRRVWKPVGNTAVDGAIEIAELFADFQVNRQRLKAARQSIADTIEAARREAVRDRSAIPDWVDDAEDAASWAMSLQFELPLARVARLIDPLLSPGSFAFAPVCIAAATARQLVGADVRRSEERVQCSILRDIFGNPFRPVAFSTDWRTATAVSLARRMYDARDFGLMPILADALQDAGCEDADVLDHCRDPQGVHVRGCWVVDLALGKL